MNKLTTNIIFHDGGFLRTVANLQLLFLFVLDKIYGRTSDNLGDDALIGLCLASDCKNLIIIVDWLLR